VEGKAPGNSRRPSRDEALGLLHEWVANPGLRKHCYAVEAAVRAYARRHGEDEELWGMAGLLHDFDWEKHPDAARHPVEGVAHLREKGYPEEVCRAILGHAAHTGVPRDTLLARTLFACDELSGFLVACALVTPAKSLCAVEVASVKKKLKRLDFARNVNREEIVQGAAELGVELDDHIGFVLEALRGVQADLGL